MKLGTKSLIGLALALTLAATSRVQAVDPDPAVKKTFDKLMDAVKANDREAFIANGTDAVKKGMTQEIMDAVSKLLSPRLKKGYEATYLCQLKQSGTQVHLWKLSFKDGGDDVIIRIALKDGKVDGFFLQ